MWINLIIIFQLLFFDEYKTEYEKYLKIKENCDQIEKKLENYGREIEFYTERKEKERAKKILKESHQLSLEYNQCRKNQKNLEKKLKKLKTKAREEVEKAIEEILSSGLSSRENFKKLSGNLEKLKFLEEEGVCPVPSFKGMEIDKNEPQEVISENLKILNSLLYDIKKEKEKIEKTVKDLEREKALRENLWDFLKKMEAEGGGLLDTRISEGDLAKDIDKIEKELESCQNALKIYQSLLGYWEGVLKEFGFKFEEGK